MRCLSLLLLAGLLFASAPAVEAQSDGPVIYMTQHRIHPAKMDSLIAMTKALDIPWHNFISENVEGYQRYYMQHDTGNEYNFLIATIYPSWDMVDSVPMGDLFPQFAASMDMAPDELDAKYRPGFEWAYEDSEHMDQIWRMVASTGPNMTPDLLGDAVVYMTQQKVKQPRVDSLASLHSGMDIQWHSFLAENVPGYERHYMRHDTGNEYNYMVVTTYPSWDMVDSMPGGDELGSQFTEKMEMTEEEAGAMMADMQPRFQWAYEGMRHIDQIWRPIVPEGMDGEMMEEAEME